MRSRRHRRLRAGNTAAAADRPHPPPVLIRSRHDSLPNAAPGKDFPVRSRGLEQRSLIHSRSAGRNPRAISGRKLMDEKQFAAPASAGPVTLPYEPDEKAEPPLDLNELQDLAPAALQALFARSDLRPQPDRTRHQLILDLVQHAVTRGQEVRTRGFLEQPN